jgi:hypothetical protein
MTSCYFANLKFVSAYLDPKQQKVMAQDAYEVLGS